MRFSRRLKSSYSILSKMYGNGNSFYGWYVLPRKQILFDIKYTSICGQEIEKIWTSTIKYKRINSFEKGWLWLY